MRILLALFTGLQITLLSSTAYSQNDWKPLWADGAPGATGTTEHDIPAMLAFPAPPEKANGCSVLVCPGGGYGGLAMDHEGHQIAGWLNERGISAYILRYRHRYGDAQLVELLSNEKQVTKETPPTFIFHTTEDPVVPVENAIEFYSALRRSGVGAAELHVYQKGRHGVGLAQNDPILSSWPDRLHAWLGDNDFLKQH